MTPGPVQLVKGSGFVTAAAWIQSLAQELPYATSAAIKKLQKNLKIELPYDLAIPPLGIYLKEMKNTNLKRYMHPYVHCGIIYNSQDRKQPKCPSMDKRIKKNTYIIQS